MTEAELREIVREELVLEVNGKFERGDVVRYDPDGFYEQGGLAVVMNDRTVASGADYVIATLRGVKKYNDRRQWEQEVTDGELEPTGDTLSNEEFKAIQNGEIPSRLR